jgi:hypothetical protein
MRLYLKNGKTIDVSGLDAIMGTIWVRRIDYRRCDISTKERKMLRDSVIESPNIEGEDNYPISE